MNQYLNYNQQVEKIKSYGVKIDNENELLLHLKSFGFYSYVNTYKQKIKQKTKDYFSTSDLYYIYMFDFDLQMVLFKNILFIEQQLKELLNEIICEKGNEPEFLYLNPKNYSGKNVNSKLGSIIDKIRTYHNPIKHYIENKKNTPPWVFFKHIDFGDLTIFYKLQKPEDKNYIVKNVYYFENKLNLTEQKEHFPLVLEYIRNYRNVIAHGNSIFSKEFNPGISFTIFEKLLHKQILTEYEYNKQKLGNGDAFGLILNILIFLKNPILKILFVENLKSFWKQQNPELIEKLMYISNFPDDFIERLEIILEQTNK